MPNTLARKCACKDTRSHKPRSIRLVINGERITARRSDFNANFVFEQDGEPLLVATLADDHDGLPVCDCDEFFAANIRTTRKLAAKNRTLCAHLVALAAAVEAGQL